MYKNKIYWAILSISRSNKIGRFLIDILALYYYKIIRNGKMFVFQGKRYKYFYHFYNRTVAGERIVEIPIARAMLNKYKGENILEVGNVLSHYYKVSHDILDKYEKGNGVINKDIIEVTFNKKYDLILSVSTMEHVGHNYGEPKEPEKFLKGIENLKKYLNPEGKIFITVPVNYHNKFMGNLIRENKMPFTSHYYMKRINVLNEWKEVDWKEAVETADYDSHFANANAIYIGVYENN
jgi:hypothetical protein